jgi:hypothetical protein
MMSRISCQYSFWFSVVNRGPHDIHLAGRFFDRGRLKYPGFANEPAREDTGQNPLTKPSSCES